MYLIDCLLIWTLVYFFPGIAFFPRLIITPQTAFALPIISSLVIYLATTVLIVTGLFNTPMVWAISLCFFLIAIVRIKKRVYREKKHWTKQDGFFYLFHVILLLPYCIKLGIHAFDRGDEIYSWNFWAIQHYFMESIDFSHTAAPYPQLFPKLLAFSYHLLGNYDLQLPVKATLIIFPWSMLTAISMANNDKRNTHFGGYFLILLFVLIMVQLGLFFDDGYADPVMSSCLLVSIVLFFQSQLKTSPPFNSLFYASLSVLCAITAAHSKQPALWWTLICLPIFLFASAFKNKNTLFLALGVLSITGSLIWIMTEGNQFYHNHGVLTLSFEGRGFFSQLWHSFNRYGVHHPSLLILFVFACFASWKHAILRQMMLLFFIPSVLFWLIFGAYQLRLGQHLIAFSFFLIVASGYVVPSFLNIKKLWQPFLRITQQKQKTLLLGLFSLNCCISGFLLIREGVFDKNRPSLYEGSRQSLQRYFENDADYIYNTLFKSNILVWVPSRYLYGLFYKHVALTMPDYHWTLHYNKKTLIEELKQKQPDYVFTVSEQISGSASLLLTQVIKECPLSFDKVTHTSNRFNFVTYKVNKTALNQDPCLLNVAFNA